MFNQISRYEIGVAYIKSANKARDQKKKLGETIVKKCSDSYAKLQDFSNFLFFSTEGLLFLPTVSRLLSFFIMLKGY